MPFGRKRDLRRLHHHGRGPDPRLHLDRAPLALLLLGPFVAFFATGYFSGFGAVTAEIYPTDIRATAQGFTYNIGRVASAPRRSSSARWRRRTGFRPPCR